MLLLTATLPPTEEQTLFDRMYWQRAEVRLIRASTVRKNTEYSVIDGPVEMSKRIDCLAELVGSTLRDEIQPDGKVVVMCESKPEISAIVEAGLFPCEPFHADMTEERKEEVLEEFPDRADPGGRCEWVVQYGGRHRKHSVDRAYGRAAQHEGLRSREREGRKGRIGEPCDHRPSRFMIRRRQGEAVHRSRAPTV